MQNDETWYPNDTKWYQNDIQLITKWYPNGTRMLAKWHTNNTAKRYTNENHTQMVPPMNVVTACQTKTNSPIREANLATREKRRCALCCKTEFKFRYAYGPKGFPAATSSFSTSFFFDLWFSGGLASVCATWHSENHYKGQRRGQNSRQRGEKESG